MKATRKLICLMIVTIMALGMVPGPASAAFTDADQITYTDAVNLLSALGVINGYPEGNFDPLGKLTRAHAAAFVAQTLLTPTVANVLPTGDSGFTDVPPGHWANKYIRYCASEKIIGGYGDGTFGPDNPVNMLMFAVMWMRALKITPDRWTGEYWATNASTDGSANGLFDGLKPGTSLEDQANREMGALSTFNALFWGIKTVETGAYKVKALTILVPAVIAEQKFSTWMEAFFAVSNIAPLASIGIDYTIENETTTSGGLAWDKFGVTKSQGTDTTGRPITNYLRNGAVLLSIPDNPLLEVRTARTGSQIYSGLGLSSASSFEIYEDGVQTASETIGSGTSKQYGGRGTLLQAYKYGSAYRLVLTNTYIGIVTNVGNASTGVVSGVGVAFTGNFNTLSYSKNDYVLYSIAGAAIQKIVPAIKLGQVLVSSTLGTVNSPTVGGSVGTFVSGGETFSFGRYGVSFASFTAHLTNTYSIYLDGDRNVMLTEPFSTPAAMYNYLYVNNVAQSTVGFTTTNQAQVVFDNGTYDIIKTTDYNTAIIGRICTYTVSGGEYTLTQVPLSSAIYGGAALSVTKGNPVIDGRYADNATSFVVGGSKIASCQVYTGYANMPTISLIPGGDWAYVHDGNRISLAFFFKSPDGSTPSTVNNVLVVGRGMQTGSSISFGGEFRQYPAFTGGFPDSVYTDTSLAELPPTMFYYGAVTKASNSLVTTDITASGNLLATLPMAKTTYAGTEILELEGGTGAYSGTKYNGIKAVSSATQVYVISTSGAISGGALSSIQTTDRLLVDYATGETAITLIFCFRMS